MTLFVICVVTFFVSSVYNDNNWFFSAIWNIIRAPFVAVSFADFYMADQLTSIAIVLIDFQLASCFVFDLGQFENSAVLVKENYCITSNNRAKPYLSLIPSVWRLLQCIRRYVDACPDAMDDTWRAKYDALTAGNPDQLWNALKYATAFPIVITSVLRNSAIGTTQAVLMNGTSTTTFEEVDIDDPYLWLWIVATAVGATYKYYWDIYHDWGLGDCSNNFLRKRARTAAGKERPIEANHMYPIWFYYAAITSNALLRISWALTISLQVGDVLKTCIACAEIFRRSVWNLLRLENEHLHNVGHYRATNYHERITRRLRDSNADVDEKLFPKRLPGAGGIQPAPVTPVGAAVVVAAPPLVRQGSTGDGPSATEIALQVLPAGS